jgi:hypothetical protein
LSSIDLKWNGVAELTRSSPIVVVETGDIGAAKEADGAGPPTVVLTVHAADVT